MGEEGKISTAVFVVRTTAGQERNVANLIAARVGTNNLPIKAILVPEMLKGYVFIEADGPHSVEKAIAGIKHVRSREVGEEVVCFCFSSTLYRGRGSRSCDNARDILRRFELMLFSRITLSCFSFRQTYPLP